MPFFIDQLGREIEVSQAPQKIISTVPSQTELLFELGLDEEVIGITKFCVHPEHWFKTKTRVGGTKQLLLNKIKELQPDLIIANKEENVQEQIEELAKYFPVWVSDVNTVDDAFSMIESVGKITNKESKTKDITDRIRSSFFSVSIPKQYIRVGYLIWKEPYMTVGGDTFISNMLTLAGFENVFSEKERYPEITIEQLQASMCQLLFLSSEPYPFKQKHIDELQPLLPDVKIVLVDGEMFSWYGSRLLKAPAYFQQLLNQVLSLEHARRTE